MIEASCRHSWSSYRKASQQVGNTHCTSLVSGARMKYTYFCTVEFSLLPVCSCASGDHHSLNHCSRSPLSFPLVLLHQFSSTPVALLLLLTVQPLLTIQHLLNSAIKYSSSFHLSLLQIDIIVIFYLPLSPLHMLPNCLPSFFPLPSTLRE